MDAPREGTSQGFATANDVLNPIITSSVLRLPSLDPDLYALLWQFEEPEADAKLLCSVNDIVSNNEPSHGSHALPDSSIPCTSAGAQSECKLQPCVHNPSLSVTHTYFPSPSGQVVQLQCLPATQALPAPFIVPPPGIIADAVDGALRGPHPTHAVLPDSPPYMPSPFRMADGRVVAQQPSHESLYFKPHQFDANPNYLYGGGSQSHGNVTFSRDPEEIKQLLNDVLQEDRSKLTGSILHHQQLTLQNPMKTGNLPQLDVPTSPIASRSANGIAFSPPYMQVSDLGITANSDPLAMEMSSMSMPARPSSSTSSIYYTSMPPQTKSLVVPPSPTPSVNKSGKRNKEGRSSSHGPSEIIVRVKTHLSNLYDGYGWKTYGKKRIKGEKYQRSYYKCNFADHYGCKVQKRTQRCSIEEDCVEFTYLNRHNHPR